MNKLVILLSPQELRILTGMLEYVLTDIEKRELCKNPLLYLTLSGLYEFFTKLDSKRAEINAFGYTPGKDMRFTMSRTQALAFYCLTEGGDLGEESLLPAVPDSTISLVRGIVDEINKKFLI